MSWQFPGYRLRLGSGLDRSQLVKMMQRTYHELYPAQSTAHLAHTVEQHLSPETPLWWVEPLESGGAIGCLWMGTAIDQVHGDRHAYVFLLYVDPAHRKQGIGAALMQQAEIWANQRGDRQIGLQVFSNNTPALNLYEQLGYHPQAVWMVKPLKGDPDRDV